LVLGEILTDRSLLDRLSADVLVGLRRELGHLAVDLDAALASRQTQQMAPAPAQPLEADRYFTIQEVSTRTGLSVSFLYELARRGDLPTRSLGMGNRPRGYRVLLSDLLAWEASRNKSAVADRVSNMLSPPMSGDEFRRHRTRLGLTQEALATRIGVHPITISKWERSVVDVREPVAQLVRLLRPASPRAKRKT
jgi:DNA-binding transcriptional regulator YiaG